MPGRWALILLAALPLAPAPAPAHTCRTLVVAKAGVPGAAATSVQAAVDEATPCDSILVAPGVYPGSVVVRTPHLRLRGLARNRVVLDGAHRVGNGIRIVADDVAIENLTVRNFDRATRNDDEHGTQVWWDGVRGWHGSYLTVYDTGPLGGYGLYARGGAGGGWDHVYASGFDDSGLYVGACRDCRATVSRAVAERNAVGYAGSNSGGHLLVEHSRFEDNAVGLSVNSTESDAPPPQLGTCDAGANRSATPTIASTRIAHCTIFRQNRIVANNNLSVPSNTSSARPGWGIGIALLGAYGDLFAENVVARNRNVGILALEFPYARPARPHPVRFQLAGNRFERNRLSGSSLDVALEGGLFGSRQSVNNCFSANHYTSSLPRDLRPFACERETTPNAGESVSRQILALVQRLHDAFAARHPRGQPAPPSQPSMPRPCRGLPPNRLCG